MPEPAPRLLSAFALRVTSGPRAARQALGGVREALSPLELDIEELSTVELVLAEVINNIVEHAYPGSDPQGPIHVGCQHRPNGLHFSVRDAGRAMPGGQAPIGMAQQIDVATDDMPEGGFGWFLIRDLAKDVRYRREGEENLLDLRLAVAIPRVGAG